MHKPILLGVEGESAAIVNNYGVGLTFEPENSTDLINCLHAMQTKDFKYDQLLQDFDRRNLAIKMLNFLKD